MNNIDMDICSVCLDDLDETNATTSLTCGHTFHVNCIIKCLRKTNECPNCRDTDGNPKISVSNSNNHIDMNYEDSDKNSIDETLIEYNDFVSTMKALEKEDINLKLSIHKIITESKKIEKKSLLINKNFDKEINKVANDFINQYRISNEYTEYNNEIIDYQKKHNNLLQKIKKKIAKKLDLEIDSLTTDFIKDYLNEKCGYYYYFKLPRRIYI